MIAQTYGRVAKRTSCMLDDGAASSPTNSSPGSMYLQAEIGSMSAAARVRCVSRSLIAHRRGEWGGIDPSAGFLAFAHHTVTDPRATFQLGDAQQIPVADGSTEPRYPVWY